MAAPGKRIKVLYTIPNFDTAGSGKALLNIAIRLDKNKFEPHIMCMHDRGEFFQVVKQSGMPVHILQYTSTMKPYWKGLWNCWKISRAFKLFAPNIIHSFHYAADYSEALAARLAGIKWVYTKKNMNWGGGSKNGWRLRTYLASHIVAQNTDMLKEFFPKSKKVTLVPRGVNAEQFAPGPADQALRKKYSVAEGEHIIICVANLVPVKGVEVLINAFAMLKKDFPSWKVWVVGDDQNEYGERLKARVHELLLDQQIIFTGKQMQVKPFLDQARIFVLPTLNKGRMEGSPVSLLEAMANGKVILASAIPGIRDQLIGFENYLFQPADENDLCGKLRNLMHSDSLVELGSQFRKHCATNFSIELEVERHAGVYRAMIS